MNPSPVNPMPITPESRKALEPLEMDLDRYWVIKILLKDHPRLQNQQIEGIKLSYNFYIGLFSF